MTDADADAGTDAVRSPFAGLPGRVDRALARGLGRVTGSALGPYQTAVIRIGFSLTWLLFLLREWPHREELYGPGGPWSWEMARRITDGNGAFSLLMWTDGRLWFELVYVGAIAASVALLVGRRTRTSSLFFMLGVLSLQNRSVFMGDGGDNAIHLMSMYLVLTRCGQVWSLDAGRAARRAVRGVPDADGGGAVAFWACSGAVLALAQLTGFAEVSWTQRGPLPLLGWATVLWGFWAGQGLWWCVRRFAPGEPRTLLDVLANLVHNGALLVIIVEVCLIYATAGWYKIQGSRWQDGTALYYPLRLDDFTPWPGLSGLLASSGLLVMVITYGTVVVQVAFPFTLVNRRVKNVLLAVMMAEHAVIAVVLGLPFFSLVMIAADAVFLPTGFLRWAGSRASALFRRPRPRRSGPGLGPGPGPDGFSPTPPLPEAGGSAPGPQVVNRGSG